MSFAGKDRNHPHRIIAPVTAALGGKCGGVIDLFFAVVLGVDDDLAIRASRNSRQTREIDGRRHHESLAVIRVFADDIDAPGSCKNRGFNAESGFM